MSFATPKLWAIDLAERGLVPDFAIRSAIRRLLDQQISRWNRMPRHELVAQRERLVAEMNASPVALSVNLANAQHYEVPAEFFKLVLGSHMKYSCCFWNEATRSLDDAEEEALRVTAERAGLADGASILELGCGWGSLTLWAAERYPRASITAVSNSRFQKAWIEERARERGLENLAVTTADVQDFRPSKRFDRIVSVEMFEHLRNYREMFRRIASWLEPQGSLFLHVFCHRETPYVFRSEEPEDWMGRHFFTDGLMPSEDLFDAFSANLAVSERWVWSGTHYQRTAEAWLSRLESNRPAILELFRFDDPTRDAARYFGRWRLFFIACAELFGYRGGEEWKVTHVLMKPHSGAKNDPARMS